MDLLVSVLVLLTSLVLGGTAALTLRWMLYAWQTEDRYIGTTFSRDEQIPVEPLTFSLLVPARHESAVLGRTLDQLARTEHDRVEIICIVGHDDPETAAVAHAAAGRHPGLIRVVVDHNVPKNKPKALNTALQTVRGDVVGVFDAEDFVAPGLLPAIERCFHHDHADIVQGGVQLMNLQTSWWSLRNCLEYFFWFRSRLHYHADSEFIPLGGNTVFIRTPLLRSVGGWDEDCLAEDCELGVRLSSLGAWASVAYDPELATREETPGSLMALVKQRTRWDQGFIQVYRKGLWRELPLPRRLLAWNVLVTPFVQAISGLIIPFSLLLMFVGKAPVWVTLIGFIPGMIMVANVTMEILGLQEFGRMYGVRIRPRDYVKLVLGTLPYQFMLAIAAVRAVLREFRGQREWEKTAHAGLHLADEPVAIDLRSPAPGAVPATEWPPPDPTAADPITGAAPVKRPPMTRREARELQLQQMSARTGSRAARRGVHR